jgi:glycosyltransferase involved in cell wall biosynthesis
MNKGINLATGEYVVFIHADDYFFSNQVIEAVMIDIDKRSDILMFPVLFGQKLNAIIPRRFNWWVNFKIPACHQGILCKLNLFRNIGDFDTQFKIDMDYDFLLRAYRNGVLVQRATSVLSVMRDTGISSRKDFNSVLERLAEERSVHNKNCPNTLMTLIYEIYWFLYLNYKKLTLLP